MSESAVVFRFLGGVYHNAGFGPISFPYLGIQPETMWRILTVTSYVAPELKGIQGC
jgi:hypothetical protein